MPSPISWTMRSSMAAPEGKSWSPTKTSMASRSSRSPMTGPEFLPASTSRFSSAFTGSNTAATRRGTVWGSAWSPPSPLSTARGPKSSITRRLSRSNSGFPRRSVVTNKGHTGATRTTSILRGCSRAALISALFEQQMNEYVTLWGTGDAKVQVRVAFRGVARFRARRLHASDACAVVECQFDPKGPAVARPPALCAGEHSGDLSPAYCRLHAQGAAGYDPGRYQRAISLLRPAGRQGGPLRRDRGRGSAGLVRRRHGWPHG